LFLDFEKILLIIPKSMMPWIFMIELEQMFLLFLINYI